MKHWLAGLMAAAWLGGMVPAAQAEEEAARLEAKAEAPKGRQRLSDVQIRQILIEESIAAYSGNCPCPYSAMANGRKCGRRSAYSRPGGEAPLCYPKDVTAEMVQAYRDAQEQER